MSWIDALESGYVITTGDGKEWRFLWKPNSKSVEYNIAEFEFPNLSGTLVNRGTPKGRRYPLEVYIQGEDHLDQSLSFEISANDSRAWVVSHPYYGDITVHPTGLNIDNSGYNVSKITGTLLETITEDAPKATVDPVDTITEDHEDVNNSLAEAYANNVTPDSSDINDMTSNTSSVYNEGAKKIKSVDAEDYFNLFNSANSAILTATSKPLAAINAIQAVINAPALFSQSVQARITLLKDQFDLLRAKLAQITKSSAKRLFQNNAGAIMSAMALASANPQEGDYGNRNKVLAVIEDILNNYNQYLTDLDSLQTDNGGELDSYIPDADPLIALNDLMNFTLSNLFDIALDAKQERSVLLESDSNLILLTHRFYGLDDQDENINELMENNNIGLNELLKIRKGRKIIYYV